MTAKKNRTFTWKRLPQRYARYLTPLILSALMSALVSAVATSMSQGFGVGFMEHWLGAWGASWVIAFPSLLIVLPLVRKIVALMVEQ